MRAELSQLPEAEQEKWVRFQHYTAKESGYAQIQGTKPATLGFGLADSPVGHACFPKEIIALPRAWTEHWYNVVQWTDMPAGGHFAAMEQPQSLVEDVRSFFRRYR